MANQAIGTNVDINWYQVIVPASTTGHMVVTMQSSKLSSLIPKVTVYNGNLQGAVVATGSTYGATVSVTISGVTPGQTWYIKAMAAVSGAGCIGSYGLLVNFGSSPQAAIAPPYTVVAAQPSQDPLHNPGGNGVDYWRSIHPLPGHLGCATRRPSRRRLWGLPHRLRHPLGLWHYDGGGQPGELWLPFQQARGRHPTPRASSALSSQHPPRFLRDHDHRNGRPQRCRPQAGGAEAMLHRPQRGTEISRSRGAACRRPRPRGLAVRQACSRGARRSPGDYPRRAGPPSNFPEVLSAILPRDRQMITPRGP